VPAGERPHAVVDADGLEGALGVAVGHDGDGQFDPPALSPSRCSTTSSTVRLWVHVRAAFSTTASCLPNQSSIPETKARNSLAPSTCPTRGSLTRGWLAKERMSTSGSSAMIPS
jgi:hypothetical protein